MRTRVILGVLLAVAAAFAVVLALAGGGGGDDGESTAPAAFAAKTVTAGDVTVRLAPHHVDATGAEIEVTLDTHSEELDMDLAGGARLAVGGTAWPVVAWDGDGPSGHHRSGTLRFDPAGAAAGTARLTLGGFAEPVVADWTLGG